MLRSLFVLSFIVIPLMGYATHLRGGQIRVVSTNGLTCEIELRLLTNTKSEIHTGDGDLNFGDGSSYTTPSMDNSTLEEQQDLGVVVYRVTHAYSEPGLYTISYTEANLTEGILNMTNSVETRFYIESVISLSETESRSSPDFATNPIFSCPSNRTYSFSTAVTDTTVSEFFYKYSLVTNPLYTQEYTIPGNLAINADNGVVTWDTRFNDTYSAGLFWIVVKIEKFSESGDYHGYVWRAIQLIVEDSDSEIELITSVDDPDNKVVVTEGNEKAIKVILADKTFPESYFFEIHYSGAISDNLVSHSYDSTAGDRKFFVAVLTLSTTPGVVSDLPYTITFRGHLGYLADLTFLYMTKDRDLPVTPHIIDGVAGESNLKVYPNPFVSELFVEGSESTDISLIDSSGREVMRSSLQTGKALDTSNLHKGFYLLKAGNEKLKVIRD